MNHPSSPRGLRTLVTGFGPFGAISDNPSSHLARKSQRSFRILKVAYAAVDQFIQELSPDSFDILVMIGVARLTSRMRLETTARNHVGSDADVQGIVLGPGPIDPAGPASILASTIISPQNKCWEPSDNAGEYLCNYVYYRASQKFSDNRVCFVHVPPFTEIPAPVQQAELESFLTALEHG